MSGWMFNDTIRWINSASRPMMLGLMAAVAMCACDAPQETSEKNLFRSSSQTYWTTSSVQRPQPRQTQEREPESRIDDLGNAGHVAGVRGKERELETVVIAPIGPEQQLTKTPEREKEPEPDSNAAAPAVARERSGAGEARIAATPLKRIDAGAAYIARSIREKVEAGDPTVAATAPEVPIAIGMATIRNQSRARSEEFEAFLDRFAKLLTDAGNEYGVSFTTDVEKQTDYDLVGTAYLLSAEGFDWWELFLSLRPAYQSWTLWRSDHPVRVLRHPRPEHQQVFLAPLPRVRH